MTVKYYTDEDVIQWYRELNEKGLLTSEDREDGNRLIDEVNQKNSIYSEKMQIKYAKKLIFVTNLFILAVFTYFYLLLF